MKLAVTGKGGVGKTPDEQEAVTQYCRNHDLDLIVTIPYDESIPAAEQLGLAPIDYAPQSPAMQAIHDLAGTLRGHLS